MKKGRGLLIQFGETTKNSTCREVYVLIMDKGIRTQLGEMSMFKAWREVYV